MLESKGPGSASEEVGVGGSTLETGHCALFIDWVFTIALFI
jgi:hypothetical protein